VVVVVGEVLQELREVPEEVQEDYLPQLQTELEVRELQEVLQYLLHLMPKMEEQGVRVI